MIPRLIRRNIAIAQSYCIIRNNNVDRRNLHSSNQLQNEFTSEDDQSNENKLKNLLDSSTAFIETKPKDEEDQWATLPYVEGTTLTKRQRDELDLQRPKIDPRDTSIILFPGQGAEFIGMAKSLERVPAAKDLFDYASEVLNYDVLKLCNEGPLKTLKDIRYSHIAIMTASLANVELLREERPSAVFNCVGTAGFSLGEITALVFAGALRFDEALYFLQVRAEAILAAAEISKGIVAKVRTGADSRVIDACKKAREWCIKNDVENPECLISNFMCPGYKILSGNEEAIQYLENNMQKFKLRAVRRTANKFPLHCKLMEPTVQPLKQALNNMDISDPIIRVYSNINGKTYYTAEHIKKSLPLHLVKPVKWEQTMHHIFARRQGSYYPRTFVCGPGFELRKILQYVNSRAWRQCIHVGDIRQRKSLKQEENLS